MTQANAEHYLCARIFGGLGNQMFQYASAFAQAQRINTRLLLHVVGSERLEHASFGLSSFPLTAEIWDQNSGKQPSLIDKLARRKNRIKKHASNWPGPKCQHDGLTVSEALRQVGPATYLAGYFQSEDYFADQSDAVRQQFSLAHLDAFLEDDSKTQAQASGAVSVHIRRGDYLYDPKVLDIHGILEDDYYETARELMQKLVPDCHFCIFSDDRQAADDLMPQADRFNDLALMSKCSHHIIANSSFSWWGAWLNANMDKQVIAPRRWYSRDHMQTTYIDDICPKGWILI